MSYPTLKRTLAASAAAAMLSCTAIGLASAQPAPAPTPPAEQGPEHEHRAFLDALAKRLGVSTDQLVQDMAAARADAGLPPHPAGDGHRHHEDGHHADLALVAAQAIGITPQELRQELPGKSLAQVAQAHGKNPADVAAALTTAANERIDHEVTGGRLTPEQAEQRKQQIDQAMGEALNRVWPTGGSAPADGASRASPMPGA